MISCAGGWRCWCILSWCHAWCDEKMCPFIRNIWNIIVQVGSRHFSLITVKWLLLRIIDGLESRERCRWWMGGWKRNLSLHVSGHDGIFCLRWTHKARYFHYWFLRTSQNLRHFFQNNHDDAIVQPASIICQQRNTNTTKRWRPLRYWLLYAVATSYQLHMLLPYPFQHP